MVGFVMFASTIRILSTLPKCLFIIFIFFSLFCSAFSSSFCCCCSFFFLPQSLAGVCRVSEKFQRIALIHGWWMVSTLIHIHFPLNLLWCMYMYVVSVFVFVCVYIELTESAPNYMRTISIRLFYMDLCIPLPKAWAYSFMYTEWDNNFCCVPYTFRNRAFIFIHAFSQFSIHTHPFWLQPNGNTRKKSYAYKRTTITTLLKYTGGSRIAHHHHYQYIVLSIQYQVNMFYPLMWSYTHSWLCEIYFFRFLFYFYFH